MPTYYATVLYNGTGSAVDFDYPPFDFISQADIEVFVGGTLQTVDVHYTHETGGSAVSGFIIRFASAPPEGEDNVKLRRKTTRGELDVDFVDGSTLTEETLDIAMKQGVYLAEEALDTATDAVITAQGFAAVYVPGDLPTVESSSQEDYSLQVSAPDSASPNTWEVVTPALARAGLELGTAAVLNTGVGSGKIPLNSENGDVALLPLNRGAYLDWGSAIGKLAVHSENDVLREAAYKDVWISGSTTDKVVVMTAEGLPALNGHNLVDVQASIPICYITYQVDPAAATTPANHLTHATSGPYADDTWETYPLSNLTEGEQETDIQLLSSVLTIPAGKWRIRWWCNIIRTEEIQTRFFQTSGVEATLVTGMTHYNGDNQHGVTCFGNGRFTITADESGQECELQFYANNINNSSYFGKGLNNLHQQIYASIEITKEAHT